MSLFPRLGGFMYIMGTDIANKRMSVQTKYHMSKPGLSLSHKHSEIKLYKRVTKLV